MSDAPRYPGIGQDHKAPYFPSTYEKPDCAYCEKRKDCYSYGKFQRDRRDFSYISGRCPRLPDYNGFVERDERELYASVFPLIHAERGMEEVYLSLSLPDAKRLKKVNRSKAYGVWWFRDGKDENGYPVRRPLTIEHYFQSKQEIYDYMKERNLDYIILRCDISDGYF